MNIVPLLSSLPEPNLYLIEGIIAPLAPATSPDPKSRPSSEYSPFKKEASGGER